MEHAIATQASRDPIAPSRPALRSAHFTELAAMVNASAELGGQDLTAPLALAPMIALAMVCARTSPAIAILVLVVMTAAPFSAPMTALAREHATMEPATAKAPSAVPIAQSKHAPMIARMLVFARMVCATATPVLRAKTARQRFALTDALDMVCAPLTTSPASASLDGLGTIVL